MSISTHGVAPFGYVRVKAYLAALRTLSWPIPSFVASMSLGIRLVPSLAYRELILLLFNPIQSSPNKIKRIFLTLCLSLDFHPVTA